MKNKPQKQRSHKRRHHRAVRQVLHLLRLTAFTAGLMILLALFHLVTIGIPSPLTRQITARVRAQGIPLHIKSITLSPHRGWVLHDLRLYSTSPDDLTPLLQTEHMTVMAWPRDWSTFTETTWDISVNSENIAITPGHQWESLFEQSGLSKTVNRLRAHLTTNPKGLVLDSGEVQWDSILLRATGTTAFPEKSDPPKPELLKQIRQQTQQIIEAAGDLSVSGTTEINLLFDIPADGFKQASVRSSFFLPRLQYDGRFYDRLGGAVTLQEETLSIDTLRLTATDGTALTVSGHWNIPTNRIQINLNNTLCAQQLLALLPKEIATAATQTGIQLLGKLDFDAVIGPASPEKLAEQVSLHVHTAQAVRKDLTLNPLRFDLTRNGNRLEIKHIETTANGGPLSGRFSMDLDAGAWKASFQGKAAPEPAANLLRGVSKEWIDRFQFTNSLPDIDGEVSWGGKEGTFCFQAAVSGQDCSFAGVPVETISMTMLYTNHTFSLDPLQISEGDKQFDGTVKLDLPNRRAFFDAETSFPPPVIAHIIAPDYPTILTNFTFSGPVFCKGSGRIDYSGGTDHAARGTLKAESVSAAGLTAKPFSSRIEARGEQLIFTQGQLEMFGGSAEGSAVFDLSFDDKQSPYRIDIDLTRMDLNQIAGHNNTNNVNNTTGDLSATINIEADATAGFWESASGRGEVEIVNGQLRDLPVLGGFSRLIRNTLPGFSLFSLTTLYAEYDVHDGSLHSDNLELGGTLLSAKAHGNYSPDKGLNFIVQAEPLRQTQKDKKWYQLHLWLADALKGGTAPLFYLLEFELKGPLDKPEWRLINLPKELTTILKIPGKLTSTAPQKSEANDETH